MDRKEVEGERPDDLKLWSIRNFEDVISEHYFKSVSFPDAKNFELKKSCISKLGVNWDTGRLGMVFPFVVFKISKCEI